MDFGNVPLAGGFFAKNATQRDLAQERLYPLVICFCTHCGLVQASDVVEAKTLFENYFYFSSAIGTVVKHFVQYAKELKLLVPDTSKRFVVEIGCNDGVFLRPLKAQGFNVLGVDPAANVVSPLIKQGLPIKCGFFGESLAKEIAAFHGQADIILGSNCLAHIDDMHDVVRGIKLLLKPDGFLSMETHYLGVLLAQSQYDFMYHEHQSYYSLGALTKFFAQYDLEIYDAYPVKLHAGSMRYFVQKKQTGGRKITARLRTIRAEEKSQKLDKLVTFTSFSVHIARTKKQLMLELDRLKLQGKTIAGYGASGRATIIMAYCGIDRTHLDYVIDDAPAKEGAYTPGNHLPICNSVILNDRQCRPDYCLLLAWSFAPEIIARNAKYIAWGGKFIVPLPKVKILP